MELDTGALELFLSEYAARNKVPGMSVCVSGPEGTMYKKGFGYRSLDEAKPVGADTIFGIASMTKSVTCACLAILESEGKLSFQDPAAKYLPGLRIPGTPREALLIHNLANMTSGLPPLPTLMMSLATHTKLGPWAGAEALAAAKLLRTPCYTTIEEIIEYITDSDDYEPTGAPGEYMSYSNDSYALLSSIADAASGSTLERFAYERLFAPLGMTRTTFDVSEAKAMGNITSLFVEQDGQLHCTDDWPEAPPYRGCGWLKSTSEDMCVYYEMMANDGVYRGKRILPEGCVSRMVGRSFPETAESVYCYGLNKRIFHDTVICEHAGSLFGVSSKGGLFKDNGYAAVVLMNKSEIDPGAPLNAIFNSLLGLPLDTSHMALHPAGAGPEDPQIYAGTYSSNEFYPKRPLEVFIGGDGGLRANTPEGECSLLFCDTTRFIISDGKKPLDQCGVVRFLLRDGKVWAAQESTRVIRKEGAGI